MILSRKQRGDLYIGRSDANGIEYATLAVSNRAIAHRLLGIAVRIFRDSGLMQKRGRSHFPRRRMEAFARRDSGRNTWVETGEWRNQ